MQHGSCNCNGTVVVVVVASAVPIEAISSDCRKRVRRVLSSEAGGTKYSERESSDRGIRGDSLRLTEVFDPQTDERFPSDPFREDFSVTNGCAKVLLAPAAAHFFTTPRLPESEIPGQDWGETGGNERTFADLLVQPLRCTTSV